MVDPAADSDEARMGRKIMRLWSKRRRMLGRAGINRHDLSERNALSVVRPVAAITLDDR